MSVSVVEVVPDLDGAALGRPRPRVLGHKKFCGENHSFQMSDLRRGPLNDIHLYPCLGEELPEGIIGVLTKAHEAFDPSVNQHLGTEDAGGVGAVDGAVLEADTVERRLNDAILLGMYGAANLVTGAGWDILRIPEAAQFKAVLQSNGGAIIAGGQDMLIPHGHRADMVPQAGRALGHYRGHLEKVFINARTA